MNGDEIQEREIGDIITGIQTEHCAKNCESHPFIKQGVIKSLRIGEASLKLHKWSLAIGVAVLISVWLKGGNVGEVVTTVIAAVVKTAVGATP